MPKPIKRKVAKQRTAAEDDFTTVMSKITETVEKRRRQLIATAVALVVVVALSLGLYAYQASTASEAKQLAYEGYKLYYSLYEQTPLPEEERINRALEDFQKAYEEKETAYSLYYVASCYYLLGQYDAAISMLRELNKKFPDDERFVPLSYYKMAMAQVQSGNTEDALDSLEALSNYRTDSFKDLALVESARILEELGKPEEAKAKYRLIAERFPGSIFLEEAKLKAGIEDDEQKEEGIEPEGKQKTKGKQG